MGKGMCMGKGMGMSMGKGMGMCMGKGMGWGRAGAGRVHSNAVQAVVGHGTEEGLAGKGWREGRWWGTGRVHSSAVQAAGRDRGRDGREKLDGGTVDRTASR